MSDTAVTKTRQNGVTNLPAKIPTLQELIKEDNYEQNALMVIINQPPPKEWVKEHPFVSVKDTAGKNVPLKYIPRERLEYMLSRIYGRWWVEIKDIKLVANSPTVTVRVYVKNPINGEIEWNDGIGAAPIQTDKDAGAIQFDKMKSGAVQMAAPSAETYAFKDAAEKFGKIFGKDLNVHTEIDYTPLLKAQISFDDLQQLFDLKKDSLSKKDRDNGQRILDNKETASYKKLHDQLKAL